MKDNFKRTLLVWSGGYDSTAIVLDNLINNIQFSTIYLDLENNADKSKLEIKARKKISKLLKLENKEVIDNYQKISSIYPSNDTYLRQPLLWLFGLCQFLDRDKNNYDIIQFGYVKGDDFWQIRYEFEQAFKYMFQITQGFGDSPKIEYPLKKYTKESLLPIYTNYRRVLNNVYTCEIPINLKPCGTCEHCLRLASLKENIKI